MEEPTQSIASFPQYTAPKGIPTTHPKHAAILMKAVKTAMKLAGKKTAKVRGRGKGITSPDSIHVGKRRVKWY